QPWQPREPRARAPAQVAAPPQADRPPLRPGAAERAHRRAARGLPARAVGEGRARALARQEALRQARDRETQDARPRDAAGDQRPRLAGIEIASAAKRSRCRSTPVNSVARSQLTAAAR